MKPLLIVTGQTATGKSTYALEQAVARGGQIINADSRQIYRYLDIITGKNTSEIEQAGIVHHMFDIVDPHITYSSHEYAREVSSIIHELWSRGVTPIVVGGSYLYIKELLYGFDVVAAPDWERRRELSTSTVQQLQEILRGLSYQAYILLNDSDRYNPHRLIRKIEIEESKKTHPAQTAEITKKGMLDEDVELEYIGYEHDGRAALESAIARRVTARIEAGAYDEVRQLLSGGYTAIDPGLKTIGYQQIIRELQGEYTPEQTIKVWTTREIQYARRQLTFMKQDPKISWKTV